MINDFPQIPIAITGMACRFPGAKDLDQYSQNLKNGHDAIEEFPPDRFFKNFYEEGSNDIDRIYCKRGGFIGSTIEIDPTALGIMPVAAMGTEPDQLLTLQLTGNAIADSGGIDSIGDPSKVSVIFGRGGYFGVRSAMAYQLGCTAHQFTESFRAAVPDLTEEQLQAIKQEFASQLGHYGADTAIGLVPNIAASRVANHYDFQGAAYTVDAACASTLLATEHAVRELESGRSDVVVTGGIHLCDDLSFWNVFSRLGAISRSQQIRPFDRRADGLLIGEGVGVFILKRLDDARRANDRIYAVIKGSGVSSDGHGKTLMQPNSKGQLKALQAAWRNSGLDPSDIGLLEAHGTATPEGDNVELATVSDFFNQPLKYNPVIGSVKSMIGHLMPAAGAAGIIKTVLSMHEGFLPPTLHCDDPHSKLTDTGFRTIKESEPWECEIGKTRLAGVNAFGFGGINAHLVLESEPVSQDSTAAFHITRNKLPDILLLCANDKDSLLAQLDSHESQSYNGSYRLAIENPEPERLELAKKIIARDKPWTGRNSIWYTPGNGFSNKGKVAFLFPGVDSKFQLDVADLAQKTGKPLPSNPDDTDDIKYVGDAIIQLGIHLSDILRDAGLQPHAMAGHSVGEWAAMSASGVVPKSEAHHFSNEFLDSLEIKIAGVKFMAVGTNAQRCMNLLDGISNIEVANDNCPHQVILCGESDSLEQAGTILRTEKIPFEILPFQSGFHSSFFEEYLPLFQDGLKHFSFHKAKIPLWSATTLTPYPDDTEAIKRLFSRHLVEPVRFHELVRQLYKKGFRTFVQMGAGRLVGFVNDILSEQEHLAISAIQPNQSGLKNMRLLIAGLWCEGFDVDLHKFELKQPSEDTRQGHENTLKLSLSSDVPFLHAAIDLHSEAGNLSLKHFPELASAGQWGGEFAALHQELSTAGIQVAQAWQKHAVTEQATPPQTSQNETITKEYTWDKTFSLEAYPCIRDHCLIRQPDDWPDDRDRFPVVPMMMSLTILLELAQEVFPDKVPIAFEKIRAARWIEAAPEQRVLIRGIVDKENSIRFTIENFLTAQVIIADSYPDAPILTELDIGEFKSTKTAETLYEERWAFHGNSYRGLREDVVLGDKGVTAKAVDAGGIGALLDAATQLAGYWCAAWAERDQQALPYRIERMSFYGPKPTANEQQDCHVLVHQFTDTLMRSNLYIHSNGKAWAIFEEMEHRRFEGNKLARQVSLYPGNHCYAQSLDQGLFIAEEDWRTAASRLFIVRSYVDYEGLENYLRLPALEQRKWLLAQMTLKDAFRHEYFKKHPGKELYPIEVAVKGIKGDLYKVGAGDLGELEIYLFGDHQTAFSILSSVTQGTPIFRTKQQLEEYSQHADIPVDTLNFIQKSEQPKWKLYLAAALELASLNHLVPDTSLNIEMVDMDKGLVHINEHKIRIYSSNENIICWQVSG